LENTVDVTWGQLPLIGGSEKKQSPLSFLGAFDATRALSMSVVPKITKNLMIISLKEKAKASYFIET
jgi:hypothetical protein